MADFTAGEFRTIWDSDIVDWISARVGGRIVAKDPDGTVGCGVSFHLIEESEYGVSIDRSPLEEALCAFRRAGRTLLEDYLHQHEILAALHSESLNTVRIITFVTDQGEVEIWTALLRVGNGKKVDNFSAGGITAQIDIGTGIVRGPLVRKNPFAGPLGTDHPLTGAKVVGIKLPYWNEGLDLVKGVAKANRKVRTVGWDLALLEDGPAILEGNDNWDKIQWQVGTGVRQGELIRRYLASV